MKNISMKNVIMGSVLAVAAVTSLSANAASVAVCSGGIAGTGASFAGNTATNAFVKVDFTPKCSANVLMAGEEVSATLFRVGSASIKGKTMFAGSTAGGSVGNVGACAADPCAAGSEATAIAKAPS
ncbi:hypothetical protein [Accumulibacter sp.]|uniref:hypothetical protein n=1 Tax=Accumulibacter sp. TaxID=2053492 RepID=UPI00258639D4|nr:hypothetical protein [Accumulibacter sp.]MCC2869947.1 hypothetical protein [Candidatus Accumulibacter phosphatis]